MKTYIVRVPASDIEARNICNGLKAQFFTNRDDILEHLKGVMENSYRCIVQPISNFMEDWNSTDDDGEYLHTEDYFISYVYLY
jgi:hypothetical protein